MSKSDAATVTRSSMEELTATERRQTIVEILRAMLYLFEWTEVKQFDNGRQYTQQYRKQINGYEELKTFARSIGLDVFGYNEDTLYSMLQRFLARDYNAIAIC